MLEADVVVANDDEEKNKSAVGRVANGMRNNREDGRDNCRNGGLEVQANGRALKVHTGNSPHLISLGNDRFSTAVTLHPIPRGRICVGSSSSADVFVYGTGIEEFHCWIENHDGTVTIYPNGENVPVQVDGLKVSQPTRLTQGCMLCLGRSIYFRFNHPQEAKFMKSVLPNTRVSMIANAFCQANSDDMSVSESKFSSSDSRRSYDSPDSWCEISSSGGTSIEDLLNNSTPTATHAETSSLPFSRHISPKVFLPGSSTLNSPASVVLGRHKFPGNANLTAAKSPFYNSVTVYEDRCELFGGGNLSFDNEKKIVVVPNGNCILVGGGDRNNNSSVNKDNNNRSDNDKNSVKFSSSESLSPKQRIVPPSPAFNRNPSYFNSKCSSPTEDCCGSPFAGSPLFSSSPRFSNGSLTGAKIHDRNGSSLSSPIGSYDNFGENSFRKADSEMKRKQAHQNRIQEQERERVERLRLEEVLTACADYEKQAQYDRFNKPQVRIKTNGSLPRDKQCLSPLARTPDSPKNGFVFTFEKAVGSISNSEICSENHLPPNSTTTTISNGEKLNYPNSPRTRIKTVASPKITRKEYGLEILENKLAILNDSEYSNRSPTVRRSNIMNYNGQYAARERDTSNSKQNSSGVHRRTSGGGGGHDDKNDSKSFSPKINGFAKNSKDESGASKLDNNTLKKYKFLGIDPTVVSKTSRNEAASTKSADIMMSRSYHESFASKAKNRDDDDEVAADSIVSNIMSTSLINFASGDNSRSNNFSSNDYAKSKSQTLLFEEDKKDEDGIAKLNGLVLELNEIVKDNERCKRKNEIVAAGSSTTTMTTTVTTNGKFILPLDETPRKNRTESRFILPLEEIDIALRRQRFSLKKCELKKLKSEQSRLMDAINNVKTKLLDIQQQKDEIIRELEMEKALLEGELKSEHDKLFVEEELLTNVHEKIDQCEKQIQTCARQQTDRQEQNKSVINEQQNILNVLQSKLSRIENDTDKDSIIESIGKSREILEEEVKNFEDFEFRLLEEEASLLSKRDELQCDMNKANNDVEHTRSKIAGLYSQKEQLLQNASDEIKSLELQVRCHTRTLQQNHSRLQDISLQLKETSKSLNEISEDTAADSCDETSYSYKTQSQEDLDRISRVTSDAPIMESGSSNSLGRRTIASLQQIERNRQLHLAQQGSHVIEEERKRMLALKRRVQDEVKAQWEEEKKQRENNCSSITSIGSDNSSVISCDRITESSNNEPVRIISENNQNNRLVENKNSISQKSSGPKDDKDEDNKSTKYKRSSYSSNVTDNESLVKLRTKSNVAKQRSESRYSVYRRESLDLRQHIESAGHQVDHCPHVFVDKTSCRGYLQKMTAKFRTWNKRWFVFDRKKCSVAYYSDKSEKKLKGGAYFQGLLDLCIDNTNSIKSPNPHATFVVKSTERVYYLLAPSIEAMRIWFDVLATEIEPYQDS